MDIATIIGLLLGTSLVIGSIMIGGGGLGPFMNVPSLMITVGRLEHSMVTVPSSGIADPPAPNGVSGMNCTSSARSVGPPGIKMQTRRGIHRTIPSWIARRPSSGPVLQLDR